MISVLVCSIKPQLANQLKQNIANTIGVTYELLITDNRGSSKGICEVYNDLLERAKFECLVFVHEDVAFHSSNWGTDLIEMFETNEKIGIVGVAGAEHKTKSPSGWWADGRDKLIINMIQQRPDGSREKYSFTDDSQNTLTEVSVLDGVFLALRKTSIRFNETLDSFHNYDLSICIDYKKAGYRCFVANNIIIEHFSTGKLNDSWVRSMHMFSQLYQKSLPVFLIQKPSKSLERRNLFDFIQFCLINKEKKLAFFYWFRAFKQYPLSWQHLRVVKYLFK